MPKHISKGADAIINRIVRSNDINSIKNLKVSTAQIKELISESGLIVDYFVGKRLKSSDFLQEVYSG